MKRPSKKQGAIIAVVATIAALTVYGVLQYRQGPPAYASAISSEIRRDADFDLYVPRQLPSGFALKNEDGVAFANGILFMKFVRDDQTIFLSQQKKPTPSPDIMSLKGFKKMDVPIGTSVTGEQDGSAAAITLTETSLITVTGDGTVSSSDLGLLTKRLQKIE